jgi:DeoR/GlpR family transcriptional regulator of sugar metabolism
MHPEGEARRHIAPADGSPPDRKSGRTTRRRDAGELATHAGIDIELIGGRLFKHSIVSVGAVAAEAISRVRADTYFMGVTGVHAELGLTTGDAEEAAIKRALSRQAGETVVLASREKLGAASPFVVLPLSEIDALVIEDGLPEELIEPWGSCLSNDE